jgi:phosphomannomutase
VTTPGPSAGKGEWRAWARELRRTIDWEAASEAIVAALRGWGRLEGRTRVLLYDPLPDEADLGPLADEVTALLTRTPNGGELTIHPFDSEREAHRLGFGQPVDGSTVVDPTAVDVALVPGLAFDRNGMRLGRGGGHYDRLLPALRPDALVVGVSAEALLVDQLPAEAHDVRMTHLVTEAGVFEAGSVAGMVDPLIDATLAWIDGDPDPDTRGALEAILDADDRHALEAAMGEALRFGTAGIRGEVGPGSARMNRATVIRVTKGLADYLAERDRGSGIVVVGFDARPASRAFAEDAVGVLAAAGHPVHAFIDVAPTPLVAHTALRVGATAAVVITASHNPPADNGYKVYDVNGAQIVPPVDAGIAAAVDRVGPAADVPRIAGAFALPEVTVVGDEAVEAYLEDLLAFRGEPPPTEQVSIVYTPLHGVGGVLAVEALRRAGHGNVLPVAEQFEPDGRFPTVDFPNPEEPGALDLAEALASQAGADLVLANDPDGDRLAVSVPVDGAWRRLSGNDLGLLLADFVLDRTGDVDDRLVVNTIVSCPMLASIAAGHGAAHVVTLTGFKWICNAALDLERQGRRFVFGYEEALGYAVGPAVRDKDGISAAVWFADLAGHCAAVGESVLDRLARLYVSHGLWVSVPRSIVREGSGGLAGLTAGLDRLVAEAPSSVGGLTVEGVTDYRSGAQGRPRWLPDAPLVVVHLEGGSRVLARPSGTEPKMKIYADVRDTVDSAAGVPAHEAEALARAERIADEVAAFFTDV